MSHLAPQLLHPSPSSIEPYAGRIELQTPAAIDVLHRSSALPSTNHLRPFSARLDDVVSFPVVHSTSLAPSPFDSRAAAGNAPHRRGCQSAAVRTPRAASVRGPVVRPSAPAPSARPDAAVLTLPPAGLAAATPAMAGHARASRGAGLGSLPLTGGAQSPAPYLGFRLFPKLFILAENFENV